MPTHAADRVLDFLELTLVEGKFYTIFSILFGIGFAILLSRSRAKGIVFHRFFLRRAFFLVVIGAAHAVLVWHDDILEAYAVCGALLLPFVAARTRTILALAVAALLAPIPIKLLGGIPSTFLTDVQTALLARFGFTRETVLEVWTTGSYADIVRLNLTKWFSQVSFLITSGMLAKIYGCFLLGLLLGRSEAYKKLELYRPLLKRVALGGLAIGLPLNVLYASTLDSDTWVELLSGTFGILPLSAAYVSLVALIWLGPGGPARLRHFAPVGRMALTNYIGQSVICTLVFRAYGLGLGGTMGHSLYLPIGFAVYGFEMVTSRVWLGRFQFGPLEWLWRMLTYGKWYPIVKRSSL